MIPDNLPAFAFATPLSEEKQAYGRKPGHCTQKASAGKEFRSKLPD